MNKEVILFHAAVKPTVCLRANLLMLQFLVKCGQRSANKECKSVGRIIYHH
jgi:hypothetical protein